MMPNLELMRNEPAGRRGAIGSSGMWRRTGRTIILPLDSAADLRGESAFEYQADELLRETSMPTLRQGARGAAVRDLQNRLNSWIASDNAGGLSPLTVDGDFGPRTRAAVIAYQRANRLAVDGIVGPQTWSSLLRSGGGGTAPAPAPNGISTQLPPGPGYYSYTSGTNQFGLAGAIRAMQAVGAAWQQANPAGPRLGIGHISLRGGGPFPPHSSHQRGVDIDIRPVRNDGQEAPVTYQMREYSRALTQQAVDLVRGQRVLGVRTILFNDPAVRGVTPWAGHDNHLHVSFQAPAGGNELEFSPRWGEVGTNAPQQSRRPSLADYAAFNRNAIDQVRSAGKALDCADLAIEVWIAFAERYRLPISFRIWDSKQRKYVRHERRKFRSAAAFTRYVQSNLGAIGLIRNTYAVPGGHRAARPGDVFLWEYRHQKTNRQHRWGHTQLFYQLQQGPGGPDTDQITIAQGSLPPIVPRTAAKPASYFASRRAEQIGGQPHWGIPIGSGPRRLNAFRMLR